MLLQRRLLAGLAALIAVLLLPTAGSAVRPSSTQAPSSRLQTALIGQMNAFRATHGLAPLRVSGRLNAAANVHSTQMARLGYFSHDSADGASFLQRIARYYPVRGYRSWYAGENILWASPDVGAARALRMWIASPPHLANLLSPRWREVGLAAVHSTHAPGVYRGYPATIVTADFGARSR
jgi:uncharacterized protein YkwD